MTSLIDTTLTKVTYGKYATRVPDEVAYGIYEWFSHMFHSSCIVLIDDDDDDDDNDDDDDDDDDDDSTTSFPG